MVQIDPKGGGPSVERLEFYSTARKGWVQAGEHSTKRGAETVRDWQVFYLLKIYEHVKGAAPTVFPSLSTPTQSALEPGRYWLWARDPLTGRISERALVRVAGQNQLQVDLPVPWGLRGGTCWGH